ncbi:hypothetical protein [Cupriavidus metallidurans]|uniref:hypothetical protein n=1 Tax=Cupriavidus metallidurans TaxID=119219 RepID=UPI000CE06EF4|nr:hypothetical protein [Cupriavidus metallidurans]AVA38257.1 hypothetical protein C3Z06_32140 [Cupriavidus metallidurans]
MQTKEILQELIAVVEGGGDAAVFLGHAFVSFYRGGKNKIDLRSVDKLDQKNFRLFSEMLTLRRRPGWSDDELFQAEQTIKHILGETA